MSATDVIEISSDEEDSATKCIRSPKAAKNYHPKPAQTPGKASPTTLPSAETPNDINKKVVDEAKKLDNPQARRQSAAVNPSANEQIAATDRAQSAPDLGASRCTVPATEAHITDQELVKPTPLDIDDFRHIVHTGDTLPELALRPEVRLLGISTTVPAPPRIPTPTGQQLPAGPTYPAATSSSAVAAPQLAKSTPAPHGAPNLKRMATDPQRTRQPPVPPGPRGPSPVRANSILWSTPPYKPPNPTTTTTTTINNKNKNNPPTPSPIPPPTLPRTGRPLPSSTCSSPSSSFPPRRPRSTKWTGTQLASLASCLESSFDFPAFASTHKKTPRQVRDAFEFLCKKRICEYSHEGGKRAKRFEREMGWERVHAGEGEREGGKKKRRRKGGEGDGKGGV